MQLRLEIRSLSLYWEFDLLNQASADPSMHAQTLALLPDVLDVRLLSSLPLPTTIAAPSKSNETRYTLQLSRINLDVFDLPYQHVRRHR